MSSIDTLKQGGFKPTENVQLIIEAGRRDNLLLRTSHIKGDRVYVVTSDGMIHDFSSDTEASDFVKKQVDSQKKPDPKEPEKPDPKESGSVKEQKGTSKSKKKK